MSHGLRFTKGASPAMRLPEFLAGNRSKKSAEKASQREREIGYQKDNYASRLKSSNFSTSLLFLAFMSFSVI